MARTYFHELMERQAAGEARGIPSICSAHPLVLEATLAHAAAGSGPVLIEATCNQVNQEGGYTGMTPEAFRDFVLGIAERVGFDPARLILGGDHLGPNPWRHLPASEAMEKAVAMVAAYTSAGFTKIHLDASMSCADDPVPLPEATMAERAARLAAAAERVGASPAPVYVIGTEVPVPGGATEHVDTLEVTTPQDARATTRDAARAFEKAGVGDAFGRAIALVVQPGVEFGHDNVIGYDPEAARKLVAARADLGLLFEAHSTDYQPPEALAALVRDGFAILKVGPWLTFALREALYSLDAIAMDLFGESDLRAGMEALMLESPGHWQRYYPGDAGEQKLLRHFSYSDRIRYYWGESEAQRLVAALLERFGDRSVPETLISQYLAPLWPEVVSGALASDAHSLLLGSVTRVLRIYEAACNPEC
ncbi:D-tagatose-bisphosphate aldolase, class II, non-catalytic subunit [Pseudoroseicyclus sp. H15]